MCVLQRKRKEGCGVRRVDGTSYLTRRFSQASVTPACLPLEQGNGCFPGISVMSATKQSAYLRHAEHFQFLVFEALGLSVGICASIGRVHSPPAQPGTTSCNVHQHLPRASALSRPLPALDARMLVSPSGYGHFTNQFSAQPSAQLGNHTPATGTLAPGLPGPLARGLHHRADRAGGTGADLGRFSGWR